MADKKFSQFTSQAMTSNSKLVGIDGTANTIYDVTQLQTGILTSADNSLLTNNAGYLTTVDLTSNVSGTLPVSSGGTGSTNLSSGFLKGNGTSPISSASSIDLTNDVANTLPITNGGTGSASTWKAVQQFVWNGVSTAYANIPNATDVIIPFDNTPLIDQTLNTGGAVKWVISTTSSGLPNPAPANQSEFTLGNNGGGIWRVDVLYPSFNLINFVQARLSLDINGTIIPLYSHDYTTAYQNDPNFVRS